MVIAEDGVASLLCAQFNSLVLLVVPEPLGSVSVWSVLESWLPRSLISPVCKLWVGSRERACVRGVERAWVGVVPCARVGGPSLREARAPSSGLLVGFFGEACSKQDFDKFQHAAVLALYDGADEIRCQIVEIESRRELIQGHDMSGPDFAAKQGCEFVSVNDMGEVVIQQRREPGNAQFHEGISAMAG
eukprot:1148371-Pelagomonas_calceolata.AAC.2